MERVLHCSNCGGQLAPELGARQIRCKYCDAVTVVEDEPPPPPPRAEPKPPRGRVHSRARVRSAGFYKQLAMRVGIGLAIAGVLGWLAYTYFGTTRQWQGTPLVADVNGDGVEDILGHWQETARDKTHSVVGLIDGASHRVQWTYELPANKWAADEDIALADGGALAVGLGKPQLVVLDARTGKVRSTIDLPDLVHHIVAHGHEAHVWLHEGPDVTVDLATGTVQRGPNPAWAPFDSFQDCPPARCKHGTDLPDMKVIEEDFEPGSDDAIAVGRKETGTHLGMLAGVSVSTGAIRWTRTLSNPDGATRQPGHVTVGHGRAYFDYEVDASRHTYHVAAISMLTGEVVWDRDLHDYQTPWSVVAGARAYVATRDGLLVLDAQTGKTITTLW